MAVYLYNLAFSVTSSDAQNGNFSTTSLAGFSKSLAWYSYNQSGVPSGVIDGLAALGSLNPSQWSFLQDGDTVLNVNSADPPTDFILVRLFNWEPSPPSPPLPAMRGRVTAVFGHGANGTPSTRSSLQSPLVMGSALARPVVDFDASSNTTWPTQTAGQNEWIYCLGGIHGGTNDYTFNVGASIYVPTGSFANVYAYGHDPQLHVTRPGGSMNVAAD